MLSGTASDTYNSPLPHANISIALDGRTVASTHTDSNGHYSLYVLPNDNYTLQASLDGYFNFEQPLPVARTNEQLLINSLLNDIQLTSLPLNRPKMLLNIFDQGANSELSTSGKTSLNSIIKFLRDNPNIHATIDIYCDQTYDDAYNNILIEQRINTLYQYLCTYLPSDRQFSIRNGNNADKIESSATGADLIFITLN